MQSSDDEKDEALDDKEAKDMMKVTDKKFMSRAELEDHWRYDCEAFFFFCPTCGKQFK